LAAAEVVAAVAAAPDGRPQPAVGAEAEAEAVPAGAVVAALASLSAAPDAAAVAVAVAVPGVRAQRVQPAERASALPRVSAAVVEAERPGVFAPVPAFSG
jgi:hypothetical protein